MNRVDLIGNLTRDPEVRYGTADNQMAIAKFSLAINRGKDSKGNDLGADFPSVTCFGKTAELVEKYLKKGRKVAVCGRIQTGFYEKEGRKIYTTDVIAERVEFLDWGDDASKKQEASSINAKPSAEDLEAAIPEGFARLEDEDIPF